MKDKSQGKKRYTLKFDEMAFDTLFKNIPVPMFILNADRRICKITLIAEEILSKSTKETENLPFGNALNCAYSLEDPRGCGFGLYQTILNEFLIRQEKDFEYVNLEQDLGVEGLRKAKQSYHPIKMVNKYIIKLRY